MLFSRQFSVDTSVKNSPTCILAFSWVFFLTAGIFIGERCSFVALLTLLRISGLQISILPAVVFPLIILISSLMFLHLRFYCGLVFWAGCRGLGFGFLIGNTWAYHNNAGWLICLLVFFSSFACALIELWFWFTLLISKKRTNVIYGLVACFLELSAVLIQCNLITPFITGII